MASTGNKAIGIDIGGTSTGVGAVDESGHIQAHAEFPTHAKAGFEAAVEHMARAARQVVATANWSFDEVAVIGVGCTGPVDRVDGTIHNPYTLPCWENKNIVASLHAATGKKVRLENDANAALLGEHWTGAGRGIDNIVMLTLGTGVGGGVLVNGRLYRGFDGVHPELGHIPVDPDGPECYCGQNGCLEVLASGTAITQAAISKGFADSRQVFLEAAKGNHDAEEILGRVGHAIGRVVGILMHTFLPELVVLGGGVMSQKNELLLRSIKENLKHAALVPRNSVQIARAELGTRAGVVGAASLVFNGS